jgi:hypothetical protein
MAVMLRVLTLILSLAGLTVGCFRDNPDYAGGTAGTESVGAPLAKGAACDPDADRCAAGLRCCDVVIETSGGEHKEDQCIPESWCSGKHHKEDE